jgi:hypothetical protein
MGGSGYGNAHTSLDITDFGGFLPSTRVAVSSAKFGRGIIRDTTNVEMPTLLEVTGTFSFSRSWLPTLSGVNGSTHLNP